MEQIHSDNVEILNKPNQILSQSDAIITNFKNVGLAVMVADCIGVMHAFISKECVGVVHGRAGITKSVVSKNYNLMRSEFNADEILVFTTLLSKEVAMK